MVPKTIRRPATRDQRHTLPSEVVLALFSPEGTTAWAPGSRTPWIRAQSSGVRGSRTHTTIGVRGSSRNSRR